MLNLPYFMTGFFTSLTKTTSWILVRVFITIFATPYWHWLPLESYFLGTTESNLYYSIFLHVLCIFLVSFRASYLVDAPFNPESSHNHQYSVGLPLSSNNFFLWSIPPPPLLTIVWPRLWLVSGTKQYFPDICVTMDSQWLTGILVHFAFEIFSLESNKQIL